MDCSSVVVVNRRFYQDVFPFLSRSVSRDADV